LLPIGATQIIDYANFSCVEGDAPLNGAWLDALDEGLRIHPYRMIFGDYNEGVEGAAVAIATASSHGSTGNTARRWATGFGKMVQVPAVTLGSANNGSVVVSVVTDKSLRVDGTAASSASNHSFSYADLDARL
jgi:hypothetical protein